MGKEEYFMIEFKHRESAPWTRMVTQYTTRAAAREIAWCHLTKHEVRQVRILHYVSEAFVLATVDKGSGPYWTDKTSFMKWEQLQVMLAGLSKEIDPDQPVSIMFDQFNEYNLSRDNLVVYQGQLIIKPFEDQKPELNPLPTEAETPPTEPEPEAA